MGYQRSGNNSYNGEFKSCDSKPSKGAVASMINSEIGAVLAVMRRNVRFITGDDQLEHSLIHSLKELRKQIFSWQNLDARLYIQPFLDVILSVETGAPITGVALSSVYKILTLHIFTLDTAMHIIVDAVKNCRFEVTDPASEEVVLMKILQVLLACIKSKASNGLSNQDICTIFNTCLRVVHQSSSKSELLQRISRHTMHDLVRSIFSQLPYITPLANQVSVDLNGENAMMMAPFGIPCMVEIFHFLCTLLNVGENDELNSRSNPIAFDDEDVPLFTLGLINSAIELGGTSFHEHPKLMTLIEDELFCNLMKFGMSISPLILSTVCSIVLNLYLNLRTELKVQLEAFFSCVLLPIAQSKHGSSQQQEVAMEALVDLCRQHTFMAEVFANFDCDITCSNVFEDVSNLLSKNSFPVNGPLSAMHILALDGLISVVQGMAERVGEQLPASDVSTHEEGYEAFWTMRCENYGDPNFWVPFVRKAKHIKKKLMLGADHFNRDPKGLQHLQAMHLLPEELDPKSVACFFRYTCGFDKNLIGDFLGNHDQFCVQVLHEFAKTFDFQNMNLDTALRLFVGTFRLPGESQKIERVLEAFSERYCEQSPQILINKGDLFLLSYAIIMLNTDCHNSQAKKKMTEEDFIRNTSRCINGGADLPREYFSEIYHSICDSEIHMIPDQGTGFQMMTASWWISVIYKSKETSPYILCDTTSDLDRDMFYIVSGPTIAAASVVFEQAEQEDVLQRCVDGLMTIAKLSAYYLLNSVLDDLVVSLCKFTPFFTPLSVDEAVLALGENARERMATEAVFLIANKYGDYISSGWKNILECVLILQKLQILPAHIASDTADDPEPSSSSNLEQERPSANPMLVVSQVQSSATPRKSSSLIGRFSQLLSFDMEETKPLPTEKKLAAYKNAHGVVKDCHIDSIFLDSKFLQAESLQQFVNSLIKAAEKDEASAVFCLELLIAVTLNNRDRILLIWQTVYLHISGIVQSTSTPCPLVEKAIFGVLKICQRLLPYKENLTDELLKSLQLVLKLDARVADAYCEPITQEVARLVKANASYVRSHVGWRTIISLLSISARHPEASEAGFEALRFIMSEGAYLLPSNYFLCLDAARQFAESRVGEIDQSISAIDLMSNFVLCLARWSQEAKNSVGEDEAMMKVKLSQDIGEMWLRLVNSLKRICLDQHDQVRTHAILMLHRSIAGADGIILPQTLWFQCFDSAIFPLLDELLDVSVENSRKSFKKTVEETLVLATKLMSNAFLQSLQDISQQPSFCRLWLGVLNRLETYMSTKFSGKRSEKIHELIPELLKNTLLVMKTTGVLLQGDDIGSDSFWQLTWLHVMKISPSLQSEVFPQEELDQFRRRNAKTEETQVPENAASEAVVY